ncbi:hypothetical protein DFR41_110116 [Pseudacidovorax intermedius]|uniref:Uncharacterized protein n=1 Tax=Pseudacidovorax intermedius TaxID=433924 RepID=A0A370FCY2_9BURK|nr:hypothetical protein [Pseudacidovorax intermedius]RDI20708.1 hypothetical protein DFR41_110116 [Pseudacidovorax intermedius]
MTTSAPAAEIATATESGLDRLVYCRMSTADLEEAKRLAAQEDRKVSAFVRAMYRRGVAGFKADQAALAQTRA